MNLFSQTINGWDSWGKIFQSIEAFQPLIEKIFKSHALPMSKVTHLIPGTNAVFRVGGYVAKIFAPDESGLNTNSDYATEIFGMNHAAKYNVPIPDVTACGSIQDKYLFKYIVMRYIDGKELTHVMKSLTPVEKRKIGEQLRDILNLLNVETEKFNDIDTFGEAETNERWNVFSDEFNSERIKFIRRHKDKPQVYVHGDLHPDNIIIEFERGKNNGERKVYIIDFADSHTAPSEYEIPAVILPIIGEPDMLKGFIGDDNLRELADKCFLGLMLHDFGAGIINDFAKEQKDLNSIYEIHELILHKLRLIKDK